MSAHISSRDTFLKAEVRDGVEVSSELKRIWKAELDLLELFIDICERHHLHYVVSGGTLLGAIRHKGYIPWDDDIDVVMFREDYDRFIRLAPKELPAHCFLQTAYSDPPFNMWFAKLRNSNTTAISKYLFKELGNRATMHQGIFIDIFPLDSVDDDPSSFTRRLKKAVFFRKLYNGYFTPWRGHSKTGFVQKALVWSWIKIIGYSRFCWLCENVFRRRKIGTTEKCGLVTLFMEQTFTNVPVECYREAMTVPFEYLDVKVSRHYDRLLTEQYGDWQTPKKVSSWHGELIFDTERPYLEVRKERFGF